MASFLDKYGGCACARDKCTDDCATYRRLNPKPVTNYDRIISKTPEELAEFCIWMCPPGYDEIGACEVERERCYNCWMEWLQREAQE